MEPHFFGVDRITSDLYAMETTSMILISERATIMLLVCTLAGASSQYPFQVFTPPSEDYNSLTLLAATSTLLTEVDRMVVGNEERGAIGGTHLSITSHLMSTSSGLAGIDLTQETLDEKSREKLKGKMR